MTGWPYALALAIAAVLAWDGWRRHLAITTRQLGIVYEFQELLRKVSELEAQTKAVCELQASKMDEKFVELETRMEAGELKAGMAQARPGRRFG